MRTGFHLAALFIALVTLVLWFFGGPNMGWTKVSEVVRVSDSVTQREIADRETRFLPGLDFLALGLVGAGVVWGMNFLVRKK